MKDAMETEAETLRVEDTIDGIGTVIFEWDRSYHVIARDENGGLLKEFTLYERTYTKLFDLIDEISDDPTMLTE